MPSVRPGLHPGTKGRLAQGKCQDMFARLPPAPPGEKVLCRGLWVPLPPGPGTEGHPGDPRGHGLRGNFGGWHTPAPGRRPAILVKPVVGRFAPAAGRVSAFSSFLTTETL